MSAAEPVFRCATEARDRGDAVVGTAPPARHWLLLEHPGPWPIDAVAGSGIEPVMLSRLMTTAAATGTRILLIRRPGRAGSSTVRRWILASLDGATVAGTWVADADLAAAADAMGQDRLPGAGDGREPVILVCAHGVHDVCCALRGRPVAAALAARWPEQVWECSHVGGDRFAPNVVLLPDGFYYGNLDPRTALATVEQHLSGTVSTAHLRGLAQYAPPVQAAVAAAYERMGPFGPHDIEVESTEHRPPGHDHVSHTTVVLHVPGVGDRVRVEVLGVRRPVARLTCRAPRETTATEYRIASFLPAQLR